jgi:hypothetical protein
MTSKTLKSAIWLTLATSAVALAAGPGTGGVGGGGGGGGGGPPTTEAGFSLSVPAIIAGVTPSKFVITCPADAWTTLTVPSKGPVYYPAACALTHDGEVCVAEGNYFVQRDAAWQAPCRTYPTITAIGAWGDNLAGDAMLKVGSPIRVELVLWNDSTESDGQLGYKVIKLEPAELDRLSDYGHLAVDNAGTWEAAPMDVGAIVHDPAATLRIVRLVDSSVAYEGVAGAEINATGKIVYGHNLRVSLPGTYRITYTLPNVSLNGCDLGVCANHEAYLDIEVGAGGGGGGGKGGGQGGGKPIKP